MELKPVDSSNVAAVAWDDGVIRIQFRDGLIYEQMASEATYEALLASPSKGRFVREHLANLRRVGAASVASGFPTGNEETIEEPVSPIVEMFLSDDCCTKIFQRASIAGITSNEWTCPRCGTLWRGKTDTETSIRSWTPAPAIAIIKLRE